MNILPLYASLLALLFVALSIRTLRLRRSLRIAIGDAGNASLLRAMRVHSNFAEYVPLSLVLIFMVESQEGHPSLIHALGLGLLVGRVSHAYGVSQNKEDYRFRVFGMAMTLTTIIVCAGFLLVCHLAKRGAGGY